MKKKIFYAALGAAMLMMGCSTKTTAEETVAVIETEETESAGKENSVSLEDVASLLNMQDNETAELFGGGEENWTEDRSFFIGRIFQVEMDGETYPVYTTCREDGIVESVSMWAVNGQPVEDTDVQKWTEQITEQTGISPVEDSTVSEGGSQKKTWSKDGKQVTMHYMTDIMTISIQNMIGELK